MRIRYPVLALAILLLAACGGTSNKTGGSSGSSTVSPSPSTAASGTVNKSYWYAGFKVTLGNVTIVTSPKPSPGYAKVRTKLLINATFENLGPDNYTPSYNHEWALQSGTNSYLDHVSQDEKIPEVPGMQTTQGVIAFFIDDQFKLDNAVLLVGSARFNQAKVPLGKSGTYKSLQPTQVAVTGTINVPNAFTLAVSGGDLTYDDPKSHQEQKVGEVMLIAHYAITGTRDNNCCFSSDNAILKLPDGTAIASTRSSGYSIPAKGLTTSDQYIEWVFKAADGAYDFIIKGKYGANNAEEQADLPFNIAVGVSSSASGTPPAGGAYPSPSPVPEPTPTGH